MTKRSAPSWNIAVRKQGAQKKGVSGGVSADAQVVDVSGRVTSLKFTDVEKGADKLSMTVDNYTYELFDEPLFVDGAILEVSWGYPELWSPVRECTITKVTGGSVLTVEAMGKAYLLMTERRVRTFEDVTYSQVARQIADEYGFDDDHTFVDDTTEVHHVIAQASMTDYQFLADLGRRHGFVQWVDFRGFHWGKRDLKQPPRKAYTYFIGKGAILKPPNVENDITAKPATFTAKGIDPKTKQSIEAKADNDTTKRDGLAKFLTITKTGAAGDVKVRAPNPTGTAVTKATSEKSQQAAQTQAAGAYGKMQLTSAIISFEAVGDPLIEAKTLITLDGFSKALAGNYYVTEVTHSLGSGYTMTIKCRRDGVNNSAAAPGASPTNKTSQASQNKQKADSNTADAAGTALVPISKVGKPGQVIFVPPGGAKQPK